MEAPQQTDQVEQQTTVPAHVHLPEMTLRVIIIGTLLTIILAAANAYLGLKVGTTVSASIPAAVISMGILRFFKNSNILENCMVQTMASVGEALTAGVSFILPALIILHVWDGFHYWQTVLVSLLGGSLGVLFTIPLRRALLQDKSLRYPEGVAIANVLKASAVKEKGDLGALMKGGLVGGVISLFQAGFEVISDNFAYWVKLPNTIVGMGLGMSPALVAAGYICGINIAMSIGVGVLLGWVIGIPALVAHFGLSDTLSANEIAIDMWKHYVRYIGVGTMLVGGLWTLVTLMNPVCTSIASSFRSLRGLSSQGQVVSRLERDIPMVYVLFGVLVLLIPIIWMVEHMLIPQDMNIASYIKHAISISSALYVLVGGFILCSISSYFAGLIGSTNNPVSGLTVSGLLMICLSLGLFFSISEITHLPNVEVMGIVVSIGAMVIIASALAISNDTMQDLKVGELVGATPWKQQVALVLGVIASAFVIPPILQLLYQAYGIGGVFPRPNMNPAQMLGAPQAGLMATVAKGAFTHKLEWGMLSIGAGIAVVAIMIDEFLKKRNLRLPVLAVGVGIYLPLDSTIPVILGGLLSYFVDVRLASKYKRGDAKSEEKIFKHRHRGLLMNCGMVAGGSLMGVILAVPFAIKQSSDALKIMPDAYAHLSGILGVFVLMAMLVWMYRFVVKSVD